MAVYSFLFWAGVVLARAKQAARIAASGSQKLSYPSLAAMLIETYPRLLPLLCTRLKQAMQTG